MSAAAAININRLTASETSSTGVVLNRTFDSPIAHTECEIRVQTWPCHKPQNMTPSDRAPGLCVTHLPGQSVTHLSGSYRVLFFITRNFHLGTSAAPSFPVLFWTRVSALPFLQLPKAMRNTRESFRRWIIAIVSMSALGLANVLAMSHQERENERRAALEEFMKAVGWASTNEDFGALEKAKIVDFLCTRYCGIRKTSLVQVLSDIRITKRTHIRVEDDLRLVSFLIRAIEIPPRSDVVIAFTIEKDKVLSVDYFISVGTAEDLSEA